MRLSLEFSWGSRPLGQPWHSMALAAVAMLLSTISAYNYLSTNSLLKNSAEAHGIVAGFDRSRGSYRPVVVYLDKHGREYSHTSPVGSGKPRFLVGDRVTVIHAPDDPSNAKILDFWSLWFGTIITAILGAAFWLCSGLLWIFRQQIYSLAGYPELSGSHAGSSQRIRTKRSRG